MGIKDDAELASTAFSPRYADAKLSQRIQNREHKHGLEDGHGAVMDDLTERVNRLNFLWVLISCGYMVSWTSIGSLIAYFKARQGANFYVKLYCAFYLPGLPTSLLQQRYDPVIDQKLGSALAYFLRVTLGMLCKIIMLLILPFIPDLAPADQIPNAILLCMVVIGFFSWMCHGTACMLCSMFPPSSTAYLQTGFRTPELYTVAIVSILKLGSHAPKLHIIIFYYVTSMIVAVGLIAWIIICRSKPAMHYFALKDESYYNEEENESETKGLLDSEGQGKKEPPEFVEKQVYPCRVAIFLNIWSSIFTAAFFAYVKPAGSLDVELILYFVRLFSDLVGRPLARLPRPWFLQNKDQLVAAAVCRLSLMAIFFAYIGFDWFPKNDIFIVCVVGVFSVASGYLAVLSYEYAAGAVETKSGQSHAGALMNSTFQFAAFSAVMMGVAVSDMGLFKDPTS